MIKRSAHRDEDLVFGLDLNDNIMLVGVVQNDVDTLDGVTTAIAMVRLGLNVLELPAVAGHTLNETIRTSPSFGQLVSEIQSQLELGNSPVENDLVKTAAVLVTEDVKNKLNPGAANSGLRQTAKIERQKTSKNQILIASSSTNIVMKKSEVVHVPPKDLPYYIIKSPLKGNNLWLEDISGPGITLHNDTRLYWDVKSFDQDTIVDSQELEWLPFSFFEFVPYINPPTITPLYVKNGKARIDISQSEKTKAKHMIYSITQALSVVLAWATKNSDLDVKNQVDCTEQVAKWILNDKMPDLLTKADGKSALEYRDHVMQGDVLSNLVPIFETVNVCTPYIPQFKNTPAKKFIKSLYSVWAKLNFAIAVGTATEFIYQTYHYWDHTSSIELCKNKGVLSECVERINFVVPIAAIDVGSTLKMSVTVTGVNGTDLTAIQEILWSIDNPQIASIDKDGLLIGKAPGFVKVVATTGGIAKTFDVTVKENSQSNYCRFVIPYKQPINGLTEFKSEYSADSPLLEGDILADEGDILGQVQVCNGSNSQVGEGVVAFIRKIRKGKHIKITYYQRNLTCGYDWTSLGTLTCD
jgi:hypothetical protein